MDGMSWMMWGGLLVWLLIIAVLVWAAVEVMRYVRSKRVK